jgi:pimeloyl-ACP methyl ester carboxylesterase
MERPSTFRIAVAVCVLLTIPMSRTGQAQNALPAVSDHLADINGIRLHYRVVGTGPALLLIHGFTWTGEWWDPLLPALARDHRVIVVDLPGHGRSTSHSGPWLYRQVASDMYVLLDRLGVQRVRAIGHSAGGNTLVHMATQQPARMEAMVLIAGGHRLLNSARTYARETPAYEALSDAWRAAHLRVQPGGEAQVRTLLDALRTIGDDYEDMSFTTERISQIRARTLLVWGDRDPYYPIDVAIELFQAIPNAALWVLPSQEHFPLWPEWGGSAEAAREFPMLVSRFLNGS